MANNYKQVLTTLTSTDATSVYTVPNDKVAIVKTLSAYNVDGRCVGNRLGDHYE
mgnify:CR=1 FL=1